MSAPWLETWHVGSAGYIYDEPDEFESCISIAQFMTANSRDKATLAAAAPDMCRELLAIEWRGEAVSVAQNPGWAYARTCPRCQAKRKEHYKNCSLDAALTKAGLDTQEKRDAARKDMGL